MPRTATFHGTPYSPDRARVREEDGERHERPRGQSMLRKLMAGFLQIVGRKPPRRAVDRIVRTSERPGTTASAMDWWKWELSQFPGTVDEVRAWLSWDQREDVRMMAKDPLSIPSTESLVVFGSAGAICGTNEEAVRLCLNAAIEKHRIHANEVSRRVEIGAMDQYGAIRANEAGWLQLNAAIARFLLSSEVDLALLARAREYIDVWVASLDEANLYDREDLDAREHGERDVSAECEAVCCRLEIQLRRHEQLSLRPMTRRAASHSSAAFVELEAYERAGSEIGLRAEGCLSVLRGELHRRAHPGRVWSGPSSVDWDTPMAPFVPRIVHFAMVVDHLQFGAADRDRVLAALRGAS